MDSPPQHAVEVTPFGRGNLSLANVRKGLRAAEMMIPILLLPMSAVEG